MLKTHSLFRVDNYDVFCSRVNQQVYKENKSQLANNEALISLHYSFDGRGFFGQLTPILEVRFTFILSQGIET